MWPKGTIHAFEPVPTVYAQLETNTSGLRNVIRHRDALGDTEGEVEMWVSRGRDQASSSLRAPRDHLDIFPDVEFEKAVANATTIARWAERCGVDRVDAMWLDMQGHELSALKAAGPLLDQVRAMVVEMSLVELYEGCPLWPEVRGWLESQGFRVEIEDEYHPATGDALVVR